MAKTHAAVTWYAGDDWEIRATLLDANGNPFDLNRPTVVLWCLLNSQGQRVLDEDDVTISITDLTAGICAISVPAAKTASLGTAPYTDVLRIVSSFHGMTSTVAAGPIYVDADPWTASASATRGQRPALLRVS